MKKLTYTTAGAVMLISTILGPISVFAQQQATMPALYDQSGNQVNNGNTSVPAGYYYLQPGGQMNSRVYYLGNGTYYNPSTGMYGGSINNPSGKSGVPLGYSEAVLAVNAPGVPNTGTGGDAFYTWMMLIVSGIVAIAGVIYAAIAGHGTRFE